MDLITRRALLLAGLGAGAAGLAGCGAVGPPPGSVPVIPRAPAGEVVRLTYWSWLKDLQQVCDIWNAANPTVQVEAQFIPASQTGGYQKIFSAIASGAGPDLAQIELRNLSGFLLQNGLTDLARYGAADLADRYDPTLFSQVSLGDGIYAIPQDSGPMGMFYRPDLLEAVGAGPPATWAEWLDVARAVHEADPGAWLESFAVADASYFIAYATQAGASWFEADGDTWVVDMTDDATLEVARHFDTAIDEGVVNTALQPFSPGWFAAAQDGAVAAATSGSWADALIAGTSGGEGLWQVAPMPRWETPSGFGSSYLGGSTTAVLASSQHPQEALDFSVWMTSTQEGVDAMVEFSGIGWSPAPEHIGAVREEPSEFFSGQSYNTEVFVPAAADQNPDWTWAPVTQQVINALSDNFRRKVTSGLSLVDGIALAQESALGFFRDKGLDAELAGS